MSTTKKLWSPRPAAIVRAEHGGPPVHLRGPERHTFEEALRLGADLGDEVESKVTVGRWTAKLCDAPGYPPHLC